MILKKFNKWNLFDINLMILNDLIFSNWLRLSDL